MNTNIIDIIKNYTNSNTRNKIVFVKNSITDLEINKINIGVKLAGKIKDESSNKHISFIADDAIKAIIDKETDIQNEIGAITYLFNIGIIFEPSLKIDFLDFIKKHSISSCLIIEWPGEIEQNKIYFLSKNKGIEFNLSEISHLIL